MRKQFLHLAIIVITASLAFSCKKGLVRDINIGLPAGTGPGQQIVVDASRDGGIWWRPQVGPYDPTKPHNGTAIVNYLKRLGYAVTELEPGTIITKDLLNQYRFAIRAGSEGGYSPSEMDAYRSFLRSNTALLLINSPQANTANDQLASFLGLQFEGSYSGTITSFNSHAITAGVSSLDYVAGSLILKPGLSTITSLAYFSNASVQNATAMGILNYPGCRIVFVGNLDGLQLVPEPLTGNLIRWLF